MKLILSSNVRRKSPSSNGDQSSELKKKRVQESTEPVQISPKAETEELIVSPIMFNTSSATRKIIYGLHKRKISFGDYSQEVASTSDNSVIEVVTID